MIKMVAPSMAYRVTDRAIQVSTDDGSLIRLNHLQQMQNSLSFSCPTSCKLIAALCRTLTTCDFPFPPQYDPMRGSIPTFILNMWKQKQRKVK